MGATDMLVCGEDLGMIPTCVHPVMAELGLVGGCGDCWVRALVLGDGWWGWGEGWGYLIFIFPSATHLFPWCHCFPPLPKCPVNPGLRIQRMPAEEGVKFGDPLAYPYMTVASPSSHDTSTTRGWWEHEVQQRQEFFAEVRPAMADALCAPGTLMSFLVANAS